MDFDRRNQHASTGSAATDSSPVPGKQTLTEGLSHGAGSVPRSDGPADASAETASTGARPSIQMLFGTRHSEPAAAPNAPVQRRGEMTEKERNQRVDGFGRRISKLHEIVASTHIGAISKVCQKYHYVIGVRETGPLSVKRIKQGAKAKPHTILEKSIKGSSLAKGYGDNAPAMLARVKQLDLDGFVGHWQNGALVGVRVDGHPPQLAALVQNGPNGEPYVPLDLANATGGNAIAQLKQIPGWKTLLYTGDYDLHEVYRAGAGGGQIPEASLEKVSMLNRLNAAIAEVDPTRVGQAHLEGGRVHMDAASSQHAMFQHGDQATYRMNQHLEAREDEVEGEVAQLVRTVATESDEPIAWCRFGTWYVTLNLEEHQMFRDRFGLKKPHTWSETEDQRTEEGKHKERYV